MRESEVVQSCLTFSNPMDCSLPGPPPPTPSMGVSRQEYWSGVPLPSCKFPNWSLLIHCYLLPVYPSFSWSYAPKTEKAVAPHSSGTRLSDFTFTFHFHALEKEMATHSISLAWRIPWTEETGRLHSMRSKRVRQD